MRCFAGRCDTARVDAIRARLADRGAGPHVIDGGLDYLVGAWTRVASDVEARRETWEWEEWVNDLDTRELLQDLVEHVPDARSALPQIEEADARFLRAAIRTDECEWGEENAAHHGWTPETHWWYWRRPPTPYAS